jgi:hypothetical protein
VLACLALLYRALANALCGKTIVCTGIFPELGGGAGLNLGKDKLKLLVASFGGRVTGSVSGKTDILIVGKEPGFSKVSQARAKGIQLMGLRDLALGLSSEAGMQLADIKPMKIQNFSRGFGGNSLANEASAGDLAIAQGLIQVEPEAKGSKAVVKKKAPKKRAAPVKKDKEDVSCDVCGIGCTLNSWFVAKTGSDFCEDCNPGAGAVRQSNGLDIVAIQNEDDPAEVMQIEAPPLKKQRKSRKA